LNADIAEQLLKLRGSGDSTWPIIVVPSPTVSDLHTSSTYFIAFMGKTDAACNRSLQLEQPIRRVCLL